MKHPATAANYVVAPLIKYWLKLGCSEELIRAHMGEHFDHLYIPNYRIPVQFINASFKAVAKELNDPLIGVKSGLNQKAPNLGSLMPLLHTAPNIRQAMQMNTRFINMLTQSFDCSYNEDSYGATMQIAARPGVDISNYQIDMTLSMFFRFIGDAYGEPGLIIFFKHCPNIETQKKYNELLNLTLVFNHEFNGLYAPQSALNSEVSMMPHRVFKKHLDMVQEEFNSVAGNNDIISMMESEIRNSCQLNNIDLNKISQQLKIPARTLQSRLKNQGTSFRELVTSVRLDIVTLMVAQHQSVQTIAIKTGYKNSSAFYRAFRSWTGQDFKEYFSVKI